MPKKILKIISCIILFVVISIFSKMIINDLFYNGKTRLERRETIVSKLANDAIRDMNSQKNDIKLIEKFFPIGNFYINIPSKDIRYNSVTEGNKETPSIIHHNFQSFNEKCNLVLIVNFTVLNIEINDKQRRNCIATIFKDISSRPGNKHTGKLLYKKEGMIDGFLTLRFGFIQNLREGLYYFLGKIITTNSEIITLKIMSPNQKIGKSIINSFRKVN